MDRIKRDFDIFLHRKSVTARRRLWRGRTNCIYRNYCLWTKLFAHTICSFYFWHWSIAV